MPIHVTKSGQVSCMSAWSVLCIAVLPVTYMLTDQPAPVYTSLSQLAVS